MFERLDAQARRVVDAGIAEARRYGHDWFGTEHVLLSALDNRGVLPVEAQGLLPDVAQVRRQLTDAIRSAPRLSDEVLLASLGIDVAQVRRRAAEVFSADAVERASLRVSGRRRRQRRRPGRRRRCERAPRCTTVLSGEGVMMAPRLKRAFEVARKRCDERGQASITAPALLAAVLSIEDGLACELLVRLGVDVAQVRVALSS